MKTFDFLNLDLKLLKELGITLNQYGILYNLKYKKEYKWLIDEQGETKDIELLTEKKYIINGEIEKDIAELLFGEEAKGFERMLNIYPEMKQGMDGRLIMLKGREKECRTLYNRLTEKGKYRRYILSETKEYTETLKDKPRFIVPLHKFLSGLTKEGLIEKWSKIEENLQQNDIEIL